MRRTGYGISLEVPTGWSSAILRPVGPPTRPPTPASGRRARGTDPGRGRRRPSAPCPSCTSAPARCRRRSATSAGVWSRCLAPDDVFVALLEYGSDLAGTGLFERQGLPRLAPCQFAQNRMPRDVVGRSASQHFFSEGGRAFCLFTVLGSHSRRMATVPRAAAVVRTLTVETAATMRARGVVV